MFKRNLMVVCGLALVASPVWSAEKTELKTDKDKLSYSIGISIGKNFKSDGTEVDVNLMMEGLKTSISGGKPLLSDKEIHQLMNDYQTKLRQAMAGKRQQAIGDNKKKGDA